MEYMLFRKNSQPKEGYFKAATIITRGTHCVGSIIGEDSIHIEGEVCGDVKVNNVVIIAQSGVVHGDIKAKQVISSGEIRGKIVCDVLELLERSETQSAIKTNKILIKGRVSGDILCGGLFVDAKGKLHGSVQAKTVAIGGSVDGTIVCKELKITKTGSVRGKTFADRIINQGGDVEGFIGRYAELVQNNPQLLRYAHIFNTPDEAILLGYSDYHVDVEEELQRRKGSGDDASDQSIDAEFYLP